MKRRFSAVSVLFLVIALLVNLLSWATPVSAGTATWSAETIPSRVDNFLGPAGVDIRDFTLADDHKTIYAVPGNSITDNIVYKSDDAGVSWTVLSVSLIPDLVAVAPDNNNIVAIANKSTPTVYITIDGGLTWGSLGTPQESGGGAAAAINDIAISAIREGVHYLAVAGKEAGDIANVWYFNIVAASPAWQQTRTLPGFSSGDEVAALEFSPSFASDTAMVAISEDDGVGVKLQILDIIARKWNSNAGYTNYPVTVVGNAGITGLASASLSLSPYFNAANDDQRIVFIGLTVSAGASAVAASGIYRCVDIVPTTLRTDTKIHSITFNGSYLVAGSYDTNHVYYCTDPMWAIPTVNTCSTAKEPGGENRVVVTWMGSKVVAGTSGSESAFAISEDSGSTFNDISLIDTAITNARDVAVSSDSNTVYLVTDDGSDTSLWRRITDWRRVFSLRGSADYIVRVEPLTAGAVYLAKKSAVTIYYNGSSGAAQWYTRNCNLNIRDLALESSSIIYALNSDGFVSRSANAGVTWEALISTTLNSGATIVSVSTDKLLVGSQNGYVAYSNDGNKTWTVIPEMLQGGSGNVQVVADAAYVDNHVIYAASDAPGQNIKKWQIGTSTSWRDIFNGTFTGGIYGLVINDNNLNALEYNSISGQSTIWLYSSPITATETSLNWSFSPTTSTTDTDDTWVRLNATPQALRASPGKLWAVKTNDHNKLYSFSAIEMEVIVLAPANGASGPVNAASGLAYNIAFSWQRPSVATEYELRIAQDPDFNSSIAAITVASESSAPCAVVGPSQSGNNTVAFMPGQTYYFKIRVSKPLYSVYSETRHFTIQPLAASVPVLLSPLNGGTDISRKPSFSWKPIADTTEYQFILSTNPAVTPALVDARVETPGYTALQELDYGGTYFWKIRAVSPMMTDWSAPATFTVEKKPVQPSPPVTVRQAPAPVIQLPTPPPENIITRAPPPIPPPPAVPDYLRTVIIIAAALLVLVIVLIFVPLPARLFPAPASMVTPRLSPALRAKIPGTKKVKPGEDMAARLKEINAAKDGVSVSFAARSFLWLITTKGKDSGQRILSAEEELSLGKKLATRIQALAKKELLYLKFPEDAALFLHIWSHYGSREETSGYLAKSLRKRPENAVKLLKCFLADIGRADAGPAGKNEFTRSRYDSLAEVVDPDSVYDALVKVYQHDIEPLPEDLSGVPRDRAIAYQFLRIYHQVKDEKEKSGTDNQPSP